MNWLEDAARERPGHPAVEAPDGALTYAELLEAASARDPVPELGMPPGLGFAVALHACLLRGVPAMPVDPRLPAAERERARLPPDLPPGTALVVRTSGTTGAPQPVALSLQRIERSARATNAALELAGPDRWLAPVPMSHVAGLMILVRCVVARTTAVIVPFEAAATARALAGDVDLVSLVPTMLARVLDAGLERPPRLRAVILGGAAAPRPLLERAAAARVPVRTAYGLTQTAAQVTLSEVGDLETAGAPLPGVEIEIAADGEILADGLRTGDLGRLDERGRLVVLGRKTDTIITGGENVMPAEVEDVLLAHPAVADAGVFGRPDPEWGEAVTAHVVLREPVTAADLRAWCRTRLPGFKVPKSIESVRVLPRTPGGKLLRREMR